MPERNLPHNEGEPLESEIRENLVEIFSFVYKASETIYPGIKPRPLLPEQVKFVPKIKNVQYRHAANTLHPYFIKTVGGPLSIHPEPFVQLWVNSPENTVFYSNEHIDTLKENKEAGYLKMGMSLASGLIAAGRETVSLDSETAKQKPVILLPEAYRDDFADKVDEVDIRLATQYLVTKGSSMDIKGLEAAVMVENKLFFPLVGMLSNKLLVERLARPIRVEYGKMIGDKFNKEVQIAEPVIAPEERRLMRILDGIGFTGFTSNDNLWRPFQSGEMGIKFYETYK